VGPHDNNLFIYLFLLRGPSGSLGHRVPRSFWILGRWAFRNHKLVGLLSRDRLSSWCKWCLNSIGIPQFPWMISESIHGNFEMGTFGLMG
jgi:hypothetical protein